MIDYLELGTDIIESLIHFGFLIIVLPSKRKNIIWYIEFLLCVTAFSALSYCITLENKIVLSQDIITISKLFLVSVILCGGCMFEKLSFCIVSTIITTMASMLTAIIIPRVMSLDIASTLANDGSKVRLTALIFAKTVQLIISILIAFAFHKKKNYIDGKMWILLSLMLFMSEKTINLMMAGNIKEKLFANSVFLLVIMIISLLENVVVLWIIYRFLNAEKEEAILNTFIENIDKEVEDAKEKETMMEEFRLLKHEVKDLYIPIRELLDNGQYDEAMQRISTVIQDGEDSIDKMLICDTGSASINAIVNYYHGVMVKAGIKVKYSISNLQLSKESEHALCAILVNMLKNACEYLQNHNEKEVRFTLKNERGYIKAIVKNKIEKSVLDNNSELTTSKLDKVNHGYGIRIIKRMAERRNGEVKIYESGDFFISEVWISND